MEQKMKNFIHLFTLITLFVFAACSSTPTVEDYAGEWILNLDGDYTDNLVIEIKEDGSFIKNHVVNLEGEYDIKITGNVTLDGKFNATVYLGSDPTGRITGTTDFEKGSGDWDAAGLAGTWNIKKR